MFHEMDRKNLRRAVRHPANFGPIVCCTILLLALGIIMVILGGTIVLIDNIEMGPATFDVNYERYQGSSLAHITGPMFIAFGALMTAGNVCMLVYTSARYYSLGKTSDVEIY